MSTTRRRESFALFLLFLPACDRSQVAPDAPALPEAEVFDALRGTPHRGYGYPFSVSPDEAWIAVVLDERGPESGELLLLHRQSRRLVRARIPQTEDRFHPWFPACFSHDSARVILGRHAVELRPGMTELVFRPLETGRDARQTTFLDIPAALRSPERGRATRAWFRVSQDEGEFGMVETSADGATRFASQTKGQVKSSFLVVTPPGRIEGIDYSELRGAENARLQEAEQELAKLPAATRRGIEALRAATDPAAGGQTAIRLSGLAVSPDQTFLAGIASTGPIDYGVLIPLGRGGLRAHVFAEEVFGKILWSADSKAIYYYAQPRGRVGGGTVHRLSVDQVRFRTIPKVVVPRDRLEAPSDSEVQAIAYEEAKERHYERLVRLFSKPQTVVEYQHSWGYLDSGHVIRLDWLSLQTKEHIAATEAFFREHVIGKPVRLSLPPKQEFLMRYIPASRTGVFSDTDKYAWTTADGVRFGMVPVLGIGEDGALSTRLKARLESIR